MSYKRFSFLREATKITPNMAVTFMSRRWRSAVSQLGSFVCMDEKQKRFSGQSPCIMKVPNKKNDVIGHWTTQLCVFLNESSEPFVIGVYPFDDKLPRDLLSTESPLALSHYFVAPHRPSDLRISFKVSSSGPVEFLPSNLESRIRSSARTRIISQKTPEASCRS
jgi:hypothetical protein